MYEVILPDGKRFMQDQLYEEGSQKTLRDYYISENQLPVRCACSEANPRLVVAYRRKENRFDLRRAPKQDGDMHKSDCRFNTHYDKSSPSLNQHARLIAMPHANEKTVAEHERLAGILGELWGKLDLCSKGELECESLPWYEVKDNLIEVSEIFEVNGEPLFKNLVFVKPAPVDNLIDIELSENEPAFIVGEVFNTYATGGDGSLSIKLKGTNTLVWASAKRIETLNKDLIEKMKHPASDCRLILMMTVILSNTGKSIQAHSIAGIEVDKDTFEIKRQFA